MGLGGTIPFVDRPRLETNCHLGLSRLLLSVGLVLRSLLLVAALLSELVAFNHSSDSFCCPFFVQVFDTMTAFGLGIDEATQALTVSRAVQRAMKEHGLSVVEAIDDLSSKLSITKLLASGVEEHPNEQELPSRPCSPEQQMPATPTTLSSDHHSNHPRSKGRKANSKPMLKNNVKQKASKGTTNSKNQCRKRPSPTNEENKQGETLKFSSRARADSVTDEVEAKAKKARISPEEALPSEAPPPIIVRSKRTAAHFGEDAQASTI